MALRNSDVAIAAAVEESVQSAYLLQREAQLAHGAALGQLLHVQRAAAVAVADLEVRARPRMPCAPRFLSLSRDTLPSFRRLAW
eukprot:scaffold58160_cov27-Phaeocystis_antarctica.AAC.1